MSEETTREIPVKIPDQYTQSTSLQNEEKDVEFIDPTDLLDDYLQTPVEEIRPWESVQLPSRGVYYNGLIPDGYVEVKPWGLYADKAMATQRLVRTGQAIEQLFKKHVKLPNGFDHQDLLAEDRVFLLYYLRGITHGNEYEFLLPCPECDRTGSHEYDLVELYSTVTHPDPEIGEEPFRIVLPIATERLQKHHPDQEFWVKIRFLRGYDMLEMISEETASNVGRARAKNRRKKKKSRKEANSEAIKYGDNVDDTLEKNINKIIVEVMGAADRLKIRAVVERMHSRDVHTIMDFLNEKSPGIDTAIDTECPYQDCGAKFSVGLPITENFFRPKRSSRTRK